MVRQRVVRRSDSSNGKVQSEGRGRRGSEEDEGRGLPTSAVAVLVIVAISGWLCAGWLYYTGSTNTTVSPYTGKSSPQGKQGLGGWRPPDDATVRFLDTGTCNIDRRSSEEMTLDQFESVYRFKRPVIINFPKGAAGWTDPAKWTLAALKKAYGEWDVVSGRSDDIVRMGGRGDKPSSFDNYVGLLMNDNQNRGEPMYVFDRRFYQYTGLPKTLRMPPYFKVDDKLEDSIFFMGGSRSGVSFHKHADAWNAVVYGRKRWFIYLKDTTPPGGVWPGYSTLEWYQKVYPNLTQSVMPLECIQEPGEILYLPESAYHATLNLGDTIAFGIQKKNANTDVEKIFYKVLHEVEPFVGNHNAPKYKREKAIVKGVEYFEMLHNLVPNSAEVMMKLGDAYNHAGRKDDAVAYTQRAIDQDPFFIVALLNLAKIRLQQRQYDQAEELFKRAIQLSPRFWDCYAQYGDHLMSQQRYAEAVTIFVKGTEIRPDMVPFWQHLVMAQDAAGDKEGAAATKRQIQILREQQNDKK